MKAALQCQSHFSAHTEDMSGSHPGEDQGLPDVQWLNAAEQAAWRGLWESTRQLFATLDAQLQDDAKMPLVHYDILVTLGEAPQQSLRMGTLAARIQSSPSRLSHTMTRLEHLGWVRRDAVP